MSMPPIPHPIVPGTAFETSALTPLNRRCTDGSIGSRDLYAGKRCVVGSAPEWGVLP